MAIKVGDVVEVSLALDGGQIALEGELTVIAAPPETLPPDPGNGNPPNPNPEPPLGVEGAAKWIAPVSIVVSPLETGHIGHVTAWGGQGFGYSYIYSLEGAPAGVTIDADSGRLTIGTALGAGDKPCTVVVTNRSKDALVAKFTFTFTVSDKITHKTYDAHSGAFGNPSGTDWTNVLTGIQAAIKTDQEAAGDGNLRATIQLRKGNTYSYKKNTWMQGLSFFTLLATGSGANPILQNIATSYTFDVETGPMNTQAGSAFQHEADPSMKSYAALIASVPMGATSVTLKSASDASKIKAGRWHSIVGSTQQTGGYPPNCIYTDYFKVKLVSGSTITLDRPLRHAYSDTWWEKPNDDYSWGKARIVPFDLGGTGGAKPDDHRGIQRGVFKGMTFKGNPNLTIGPSKNLTCQGIDMLFDDCDLCHWTMTMGAHFTFLNCRIEGGEPDKMIETCVFDGGTTGGVGIGTGLEYWLSKGKVKHGSLQVSPRQMRTLDCDLDATGDSYTIFPWGAAFNGPLWQIEIGPGTTLHHGQGDNGWTPGGQTNIGNSNTPKVAIGSDATWDGDPPGGAASRLIIKSSIPQIESWLFAQYAGCILTTTDVPITKNWGYVENWSSAPDGSALWLDVVWTGTKPTSGSIWLGGKFRHLIFGPDVTLASGTTWKDPRFMCQDTHGLGVDYAWPEGLPPELSR